MRKTILSILLLALLLSISSLSFAAATVFIGGGTGAISYMPIRGSYVYSYTQQIYAQSLIDFSGKISKIRFFYVNGSMSNSSDWTIYMGHTSKTAFVGTNDWIPAANLTQVFSGDVSSLVPAENSWMEIPLQNYFDYNNIDNLVIAVDENAPGHNAPAVNWGTFPNGNDTTYGYYSDGYNPNPSFPPSANYRSNQLNRTQLVFLDRPLTPLITYPLYSQAEMVNGQTLRWTLPEESDPATSYDVVIDGSTVSINHADNYYHLSDLSEGQHSFNIRARNAAGNSSYTATMYLNITAGTVVGTEMNEQDFPFNVFYGHGRSLGLYRSDETGGYGYVNSLGWDVKTAMNTTVPYKIYLMNTTATSLYNFSSTWDDFTTAATLVKEGEYIFSRTGWHHFEFDVPFLYDSGNLLIGVETNYGGYGAGYYNRPKFFYSAYQNLHRYWLADGDTPEGNGQVHSYRPNLLIRTSPPVPLTPEFTYPSTNNTLLSNGNLLRWQLPEGSFPATGYDVYLDGWLVSHNQPVASYPLSGLSPGTHNCVVVARNAAGPSDLSSTRYFDVIEGTIIGAGNNQHVEPFNAWYGFGRSVSLYTYAQVGLSDFITDIGWNVAQPGSAPVPYKIWARTTPLTSLDNISWTWEDFTSGATMVKEGTYTFNSTGWHIFELDIPFWIGTSNLLIGVETNYGDDGAGVGNYPRFHYTTFTPYRHLRWRADHEPPSGTGSPNQYLSNVYLISSPRISNYPYFEGFETGQADKNRLQGWRQVLDGGKARHWKTNSSLSSYNRTPRNGSFNATLQWNGNAWLMKPFWFEETGAYQIEIWARQDGSNPDNASIGIYLGDNATVADMIYPVKPQTGLTNGDYQLILGNFYINEPGTYWLGIHGIINYDPYYISLDDIVVQKSQGLGFSVGYDDTYNAHNGYPAVYGGFYKNAREQYILVPGELLSVASQMLLRNICFIVQNLNGCGPLKDFTISMGSTDATEFENNTFFEDLTEVFHAESYQPRAGENYHELTTPFYWDGVSSLVMQVSFGMNTGYTANTSTYYSTTPVNRTLFFRSDYTEWDTVSQGTLSNKRPNMSLQFTSPMVGPAAAPILTYPADNATELPQAGFELKWRPDMNSGGAPTSYTVYLATNPAEIYSQHSWTTTATSLDPTLQDGVNFVLGQQYYWTVKAVNSYGEAVAATHSFTIQATLPHITCPWTENFDSVGSGEMPAGWTVIASHSGTDYRGWVTSTGYDATSQPNVALVRYHPTYPKDEWMITPPISMEAGHSYRINFNLKAPGWGETPEALAVHWATEPTVAAMTSNAALYDNDQLFYSDWTEERLLFTPPATGLYHFGWHAKSVADVLNLMVDDINIFEAFAADLEAIEISSPRYTQVGSTINFQVKVMNVGSQPQSNYTIYIKSQVSGMVVAQQLITDTINPMETLVHTLSWTSTGCGYLEPYAEVVLAADQDTSNNITPPICLNIFPADTAYLPIGATEDVQAITYSPFNAVYKASVAETVYLASEIQATAGRIWGLVYFNDFNVDRNLPVKIWMKNTDATDMNGGWPDLDDYTLVYEGNIDCPAGTNEVFVPVTPFNYTGGNLSIRTHKAFENTWNNYNYWLATPDTNYPDRTRYFHSDTQDAVVPHNPEPGTVRSNVPNVIVVMVEPNLVTTVPAPQVDFTLSGTDAALTWELIPYAHSYKVYASENPYTFGAGPDATVYTNSATLPAGGLKGFYRVTANTYRDYPARYRDMLSSILQNGYTVADDDSDRKVDRREFIKKP
ncbi:MAG: choice-of-anchor J domain-containing protein [Candidatus Cloacimonadaceae bacterium]